MKFRPITFGTKAENLLKLRPLIKTGIVSDLLLFSVKEWQTDQEKITNKVQKQFKDKIVIVRSSSMCEDTIESSNAGSFKSVANVNISDKDEFCPAVKEVIESYKDERNDHQVFVQEFIHDVELSGVAFTRDKNTFGPYMVINYDDNSGRTDSITAGIGFGHKTIVIYRNGNVKIKDKRIEKIVKTLNEVEKLFEHDALDIEFCYKNKKVYILQVRPIAQKQVPNKENEEKIDKALTQIHEKITELSMPHPHLVGKRTAYGNMPDWNPAEMIGIKPKPLALSLYRELITDNIWAYQRDNYGYKNLRSFPLLVSFAGQPYIDIRVSFNSFIPKSLDNKLAEKLADFYIEKLISTPQSHDKVEFDIVYSCYTLDLDTRLNELKQNGFSKDEIKTLKQSLLELTNTIIHPKGLYKQDYEKVMQLDERREKILQTKLSEVSKIYWLIEDCKRYGTLPFAGLARTAFIATQFLNSLVECEILTNEERQSFLCSINSVAKQLSLDTQKMMAGEVSQQEFLKNYGHLRPGTYDILSESYRQNPTKYFEIPKRKNKPAETHSIPTFSLSKKQESQTTKLLKQHGLNINTKAFFNFIREAIEWRELSKFIFTKNVDAVLGLTENYGERFGFSSEEMAFLPIHTMMQRYTSIAYVDEKMVLAHAIAHNKTVHEQYQAINLPQLIREPDEIFVFNLDEVQPNFVTMQSTEAKTITITTNTNKKPQNLDGKIVFIESADPGYDWIFSKNIAGLVTKYGGINSHMAVRAAELNLPAIIGCGEILFEKWKSARRIAIDCANHNVHIITT